MTNPFESIETRLSNIENLLLNIKHDPEPAPTQAPERKTLYSIKDLADFLGCSTVTAQKIKNSGRIPFRQVGRKIMFDTVEISRALDSKRKGGAK
jgi:hypothetical protein